MTDNNINRLAKLLEEKDNMPFCTYKEEARWILENGVKIPVKCKDCRYCTILNHDLTTSYFCEVLKRPTVVEPNDYCSYGELKDSEERKD